MHAHMGTFKIKDLDELNDYSAASEMIIIFFPSLVCSSREWFNEGMQTSILHLPPSLATETHWTYDLG